MKKYLAAPIAATVCAFGLSTVAAPPASAASSPKCVTKAEYQKTEKGMKKERVTRIFDFVGHLDGTYSFGGDHYQDRSYRGCSSGYRSIYIDYKNGRVQDRYAFF